MLQSTEPFLSLYFSTRPLARAVRSHREKGRNKNMEALKLHLLYCHHTGKPFEPEASIYPQGPCNLFCCYAHLEFTPMTLHNIQRFVRKSD